MMHHQEPTELLRPRFVGERFEGGNIPHQMLYDIAQICDLMIETAKWRYKQRNNRRRVPNGFEDSFSLQLSVLEDRSAVTPITIRHRQAALPGVRTKYEESLFDARDTVFETLESVNGSVRTDLPIDILGKFNKIGASLGDDEAIEFNSDSHNGKAVLTRAKREVLVQASLEHSASIIPETIGVASLRGSIYEMNQIDNSFGIKLWDGTMITGMFTDDLEENVMRAFRGFTINRKALVTAVRTVPASGRIQKLGNLESFEVLADLDVAAQLDDFRTLKDGWLNGDGVAPDHEGLDWLANQFVRLYPSDDLPLPYVYPTVEGGVNIEWDLGGEEVSFEIDLSARNGEWCGPTKDLDADDVEFVDLNDENSWVWIVDQIRELAVHSG